MFSGSLRIGWLPLLLLVALHVDTARAQQYVPPPGPEYYAAEDPVGYPVRYSLRYYAGSMPGIDDGMTQLGMFIPLGEIAGDSLLFCDLQPVIDNGGNWGSNLGLGFRFYEPGMERVFGLYGYIDYRRTDQSSFKQLTLGFDSLGTLVDLRGNLYLANRELQGMPTTVVRDPHFVGHQLRFGGYQYAMPGADFEVGLVLPQFYHTQSRLLGGVYHFDADGPTDATGARVRLETHWTANVSTDIALYHDDKFGTSAFVGIGLNWQPESYSRWKPQIVSFRRGLERHVTQHASDRLAEPTWRIPSIAVGREAYVARNGSTPWRILHVVEGAAGGNGTIERPFGTLEQAMSVAKSGDVVYTPYGGIYQPGQLLVVPESVSLLSNLNAHWIETQSGFVHLPFSGQAGPLTTPPEIHSSVYVSSGVWMDGFRLVGSGDTVDLAGMILSAGSSDLRIYSNSIDSRRAGIWLDSVIGADVWANTIESAVGSGLLIENSSLVVLEHNQIVAVAGNGIDLAGTDSALLHENLFDEVEGSGIRLDGGDGNVVTNNWINLAGRDGIELVNQSNATIFDNDIANALRYGISLTDSDNARVQDNRIINVDEAGIRIDGGVAALVTDNSVTHASGNGIEVAGAMDGEILTNQIAEAMEHGIVVDNSGNIRLLGNLINFAGFDGIRVTDSTSANIGGNIIVEAIGDGIHIGDDDLPVDFRGTIEDNVITLSQSGIWIGLSQDFFGNVRGNVSSANRAYGMYVNVGTLLPSRDDDGDILDWTRIEANTFESNNREGLYVEVTGAGDSLLEIVDNYLKLNNAFDGTQHGEVVVQLGAGAGDLDVLLNNNTSLNRVQAGEYNFDFLSDAVGGLEYQITTPNRGTVGSSDGSVPAP